MILQSRQSSKRTKYTTQSYGPGQTFSAVASSDHGQLGDDSKPVLIWPAASAANVQKQHSLTATNCILILRYINIYNITIYKKLSCCKETTRRSISFNHFQVNSIWRLTMTLYSVSLQKNISWPKTSSKVGQNTEKWLTTNSDHSGHYVSFRSIALVSREEKRAQTLVGHQNKKNNFD